MWIIPSNHPLYSAFAPECVASKEELSALSDQLKQQLLWKSKPLLLKIWYSKWSKVYWLPHLFGRTLKPSHQNLFTEKYTASLGDIPVSRFLSQEIVAVNKTRAISGLTSGEEPTASLEQFDLFGASSKTYQVTSNSATGKSNQIWNRLVTRLKKEYSVRKKLALRTFAKDSSSSQWKTPQGSDGEGGVMFQKTGDGHFKLRDHVHWPTPRAEKTTDENQESWEKRNQAGDVTQPPLGLAVKWATPQHRDFRSPDKEDSGNFQRKKEEGWTIDLNSQVMLNWPTPTTMENEHDQEKLKARAKRLKARNNGKNGTKRSGNGCGPNLATKVQEENWPTPRLSEWKGSGPVGSKSQIHMNDRDYLCARVEETDGQPSQTNPNTTGKRPVLNPSWVIQLMGTTLEKTFFAWQEMGLSNKPQKSPSENS